MRQDERTRRFPEFLRPARSHIPDIEQVTT
jgi:hypothetical protein